MAIRAATYADLWPASLELARAFFDEPLHGPVMHPHRHQFPTDMALFFLHKLRAAYFAGPAHVVLVATVSDETAPKPGAKPKIVGVAYWDRMRPAQPQPPPSSSLSTLYYALQSRAVALFNRVSLCFWPNRAAEPAQSDILARGARFLAHHWTGSRADVWDLSLLGVAPEYAGKGFGRQLVEWGFARAREEGVGCSVVSSEGNAAFYRRCGFDVDVGRASDHGGQENPLHDVPGGTIHFWDNGRSLEGVKGYADGRT